MAPVIRNTLRLKLGFYVDQAGASAYNPDAEDLYQEIMSKIIQSLNDLRSESKGTEIERFRDYVFGPDSVRYDNGREDFGET